MALFEVHYVVGLLLALLWLVVTTSLVWWCKRRRTPSFRKSRKYFVD